MCRITWVALYAELFQTDGAHVNERKSLHSVKPDHLCKGHWTNPVCVTVCVCVWTARVSMLRHVEVLLAYVTGRLVLTLCSLPDWSYIYAGIALTPRNNIYIYVLYGVKSIVYLCMSIYLTLRIDFRTLNCNSCSQFVLMSLMIITRNNWLIWNWCDVYRTCVNLVETVKTFHTRFIMR